MRNSEEIKNTIIDFAEGNKRIRAVLLNGSRANPNIKPDRYQDYDITFLVSGIKNFTSDLEWTNDFGKKVLWQLPDQMVIGEEKQKQKRAFHCLMLFEDGVRIDLTLYPVERFKSRFNADSLTVVWLDKDQRFLDAEAPSEKDYFISEPTKKEFLDYCNEFWWVSTNVAKGLAREEIIYAKEMLDLHLRPVFMKMTDWYIGSKNSFSVSTGKAGKFVEKYLPKKTFEKLKSTYTGVDIEDNWQALFTMTKLFSRFAVETSAALDFEYNRDEEKNAMKYLETLYKEM
ncbi:MAG: aminoglycoside 6-adenylyltransferase [Ginsengibacter sp.]